MIRILLTCLLALPVAACVAFDPQYAAGKVSTAVDIARDVCSTAWAKPVPPENHWGAQLVGDQWHIWLKDHYGRASCALAMVRVNRRTGVASDCVACPSF